ncbi:MAG TPA: hypothetical protein VKX31_00180 [Brumimicrobium sp.]|nr:hypothetical protein [Brumimicrobium sp.]
MNIIVKNILRILILIFAQGLIFGQLPFGFGIHPMIYPLAIVLLPFDTRPVWLLIIAFFIGLSVDFFMNTFGLHASAAVFAAFLRPAIFRRFAPRDDYDLLKEPTASEWGYLWFTKVSASIILFHHFWFFILEYFKFSAWKEIITSTILSSLISLIIFILLQVFFFKKPKSI